MDSLKIFVAIYMLVCAGVILYVFWRIKKKWFKDL
jgi:ABC-type multidrug transport system permease subunit